MCGRYVITSPVTKTKKLVKSAIQVEDNENYNTDISWEYLYFNKDGEIIGKGNFLNDKREGQWLIYDEEEKTLIEC